MAGWIIDSLYIQLGIDVSQFKKGKDEALKGLKDVDKQETEISNKRTKRTKDNSDTLKKAYTEEDKQAKDRMQRTKNEESSFDGLTKSVEAFGAAMISVATAKEFITNQVSTNLALGKSSRFIGENITKLDAWGYAAKTVGGDAQSFLGATQNMTSELAKFQVGLGGQQVAQTFARLGYQAKDGKINLLDLADSIKKVKEAQGDLVAKSLAESLGFDENGYILLTKSRGEIEKLLDVGEKMSGVNERTAESTRKLKESWETFASAVTGSAGEMYEKLAPVLDYIVRIGTAFVNLQRKTDSIFKYSVPGMLINAVKAVAGTDAEETKNSGKQSASGKIKDASSSGVSEGNAKSDEIVSFFKKKGWTEEQAKGIAANIMRESNGNPNAVGDNGSAYGLAQHHPDRQQNFRQVMGKDMKGSSVQDQLTFIDWELKNTEKKAGDALNGAATAGDAAKTVSMLYERPANAYIEADRRAAIANNMSNSNGNSSAGNNSNSTVQTHIDTINVITQAKDAVGVANGMRDALAKNQLVNFGMQGAS